MPNAFFVLLSILFVPISAFPVSEKVNQCAQVFSGSRDESVRSREVVETYNSLLRDLGFDLNPELLKKIHESGDPFIIPENLGSSDSLRSSLKQFEAVLREHSGNIESYKKLLLSELLRMTGALNATEAKVKTKLQTNEKRFESRSWGTSIMRDVIELEKGWYLGLINASARFGELIFWHPKKRLIKRSIENFVPVNGVYHGPSKSLYYSFESTESNVLGRLPIFDSKNNLLQKMMPEKINLKKVPLESIQPVEISSDGANILLRQRFRCYVVKINGDKLESAIPIYSHPVSKHWMEFDTKFLGTNEVGIMTKESFKIYDLRGKQQGTPIPIKREMFNWSVTLDQKHLFLSYYPSDAKPYGERWDLEKIRSGQPTQPTTFSLAYTEKSKSAVNGWLYPLLGTPYVMQIFLAESYEGPYELRVLDPETGRILLSEGIPIKGAPIFPVLSKDHSHLRAVQWNYLRTPMHIWGTEYFDFLREASEARVKAP